MLAEGEQIGLEGGGGGGLEVSVEMAIGWAVGGDVVGELGCC